MSNPFLSFKRPLLGPGDVNTFVQSRMADIASSPDLRLIEATDKQTGRKVPLLIRWSVTAEQDDHEYIAISPLALVFDETPAELAERYVIDTAGLEGFQRDLPTEFGADGTLKPSSLVPSGPFASVPE